MRKISSVLLAILLVGSLCVVPAFAAAPALSWKQVGDVKLVVGKTYDIGATSTDENAVIAYTSSDPKILSLNDKGIGKALATGTVTITAKSDSGEITKKVTVTEEVDSAPAASAPANTPILRWVSGGGEATLTLGKRYSLKAVAADPAESIVYSTSDPEIAVVDENGIVTPKKTGKTVLTAKTATHNITKDLVVAEAEVSSKPSTASKPETAATSKPEVAPKPSTSSKPQTGTTSKPQTGSTALDQTLDVGTYTIAVSSKMKFEKETKKSDEVSMHMYTWSGADSAIAFGAVEIPKEITLTEDMAKKSLDEMIKTFESQKPTVYKIEQIKINGTTGYQQKMKIDINGTEMYVNTTVYAKSGHIFLSAVVASTAKFDNMNNLTNAMMNSIKVK